MNTGSHSTLNGFLYVMKTYSRASQSR